MPRRFRLPRLLLALTVMLLASALAPAVGPSPIGDPDYRVFDAVLLDRMSVTPDTARLDAIVQFKDHIVSSDRWALRDEGVELVHEFHIVDAYWVRATPSQLLRVAGYHRTAWMEFNEPLEYYMQETTTVVNATRVWDSSIEGSLWGDVGAINGNGVTAVVVDTGVDAGHPDLDYGSKTIMSLKSDTGVAPWYEIENSDTSSGHGTHCAGTILGNGDASNGARAGVAPGARLIALSTGDGPAIINALGGLEWVYDHSRPGNNPYNIRVVSNSWGAGGGQYSPQDSISQAINRLTYENNVAVVFAAGNSGGSGDDIQSSNYGNTPSAINVAAAGHDGSYITYFSSKGQWNFLDTWVDVAAPGHYINSTAARRTQISIMTQDPTKNPYYLAISGTSMATPHVSGAIALLWQVAPSMRVSDVRQDAGFVTNEGGTFTVTEGDGGTYGSLAYPTTEWLGNALDTRIHESELILKLTADMIPPNGGPRDGMNGQTQNYVPDWSLPGEADGRQHDYSQGYGLINVYRAVGLALTLERIRWDYPEATVLDAYSVFEGIFERNDLSRATDQVMTSWGGEWTRFNNKPLLDQNLTKFVYVPEGATSMTVTMSYSPVNQVDRTISSLWFRIDRQGDGSWDYTSSQAPNLNGVREETIQVSGETGRYWMFGVDGAGVKIPNPRDDTQYKEARVEYEMAVSIRFAPGQGDIVISEEDLHAVNGFLRFAEPSPEYDRQGNVTIRMYVFDLYNVSWSPEEPGPPIPEARGGWGWWLLLALAILVVAAYAVARTMPESRPGRAIRSTARSLRVDEAIGKAKQLAARVTRPLLQRKAPTQP